MSDSDPLAVPDLILDTESDSLAGDDWLAGDGGLEGEGDAADRLLNGIYELICSGAEAYPALAADLANADRHRLRTDLFQPIWEELQRRTEGPLPHCTTASLLYFLVLSLLGLKHPHWDQDTNFAVAYVVFRGQARLAGYDRDFQFSDLEREVECEQAAFVVRVR
ncbi:hypothetical protein ACWIGI_04225 [Nocardia sp. NPDC055321]